jgi:hypothetical protein
MKELLKRAIQSVPGVGQLVFAKGVLRGHFYSSVPRLQEVRKHRKDIFKVPRTVPGIDLREQQQLELVQTFADRYYRDQPFQEQPTAGRTYYFDNVAFRHSDAIMLHCMLRHFRPTKLIEIGSGFSSCVTLDTNRLFLNDSIDCTFVEPYSDVLAKLRGTLDDLHLIAKRAQDVPLELFAGLGSGDVLFIDSSHVSKVGSDVNHIFFHILPMLKPGVRVHFHDIFYPFEYPEEWIFAGRSWTEAYVLRAFLQYNSSFEVELFPNYLIRFNEGFFRGAMPLCLKDFGGSIWLRKNPL